MSLGASGLHGPQGVFFSSPWVLWAPPGPPSLHCPLLPLGLLRRWSGLVPTQPELAGATSSPHQRDPWWPPTQSGRGVPLEPIPTETGAHPGPGEDARGAWGKTEPPFPLSWHAGGCLLGWVVVSWVLGRDVRASAWLLGCPLPCRETTSSSSLHGVAGDRWWWWGPCLPG